MINIFIKISHIFIEINYLFSIIFQYSSNLNIKKYHNIIIILYIFNITELLFIYLYITKYIYYYYILFFYFMQNYFIRKYDFLFFLV